MSHAICQWHKPDKKGSDYCFMVTMTYYQKDNSHPLLFVSVDKQLSYKQCVCFKIHQASGTA